MQRVVELLETLTRLPGIPGREKAVVDCLMELEGLDETGKRVDMNGNAWIEGAGPDRPRIVLCAHMDEVGLRVKRIDDDGRVEPTGHERMDLRTLAGVMVDVWTGNGPVPAYVYAGQNTTLPKGYDDLVPETVRLDLGVVGREAAEALGVSVGDPVTYDASFHRLGGDVCAAKAFDDRCGLAAIVRAFELTRGKRRQAPLLLGTVQEEIGGHGAHAVEFDKKPGAVIIVDICGGEVYGLPARERRPLLGKGPILHDGPESSVGMIRRFQALAKERDIPLQRYAAVGRGADLSILQQKSGGLPALGIIVPMAYYHGPRGLVHAGDVLNTARLIAAALEDETFLDHATKF